MSGYKNNPELLALVICVITPCFALSFWGTVLILKEIFEVLK